MGSSNSSAAKSNSNGNADKLQLSAETQAQLLNPTKVSIVGGEHCEYNDAAATADSSCTTSSSSADCEKHSGYRILALEGETGCVFCRVHDFSGQMRTFPRLSEAGVWEFATRTLLRLKNLVVSRSGIAATPAATLADRESAMIGPGDFYCSLERPEAVAFTMTLPTSNTPPGRRFPIFKAHPRSAIVPLRCDLRPPSRNDVVRIECARWISGTKHAHIIAQRTAEYKQHAGVDIFGGSLFPNPGILEIVSMPETATTLPPETIRFPAVDATQLDLKNSFGVRLVKNDEPWSFFDDAEQQKQHDPSDWPRPVTYYFGKNYAENAINNGGGLFLETHSFTQTMAPIDPDSCGFIVFGKWVADDDKQQAANEGDDDDEDVTETSSSLTSSSKKKPSPQVEEVQSSKLDLIAVRVPYGYTVIVDAHAIHGDTTYIGGYVMAMTSNHITMSSADTVFIKNPHSRRNVRFLCPEHSINSVSVNHQPTAATATAESAVANSKQPQHPVPCQPPIALFKDATRAELEHFAEETRGASFVLQPFSKLSWTSTMFRRFGWYPGCPKAEKEVKKQQEKAGSLT